MRKLLSILLVFLFVFNAGGYFFVYFLLLNNFKLTAGEDIYKQISPGNLELIKINNNYTYGADEFERINDEEIRYNGKMYDIFRVERTGSSTFFYCINDSYEDVIQSAFSEYLNDKQGDNSNIAVKCIIKIFITQAMIPPYFTYKNYDLPSYISLISVSSMSAMIQDIPSPPPKYTA